MACVGVGRLGRYRCSKAIAGIVNVGSTFVNIVLRIVTKISWQRRPEKPRLLTHKD